MQEFSEFLKADSIQPEKTQKSTLENKPKGWKKAPNKIIKINVDASTNQSMNKGATGIIARDENGVVLAARAQPIEHCSYVEVLKAMQ